MILIPALMRQRQVDICEFEASLVYRENSRTVRTTQRNPVSKNKVKSDEDARRQSVSSTHTHARMNMLRYTRIKNKSETKHQSLNIENNQKTPVLKDRK